MYCLICYLLIIRQLLVEIIVPFHDFSRCPFYALSYFRRVLACEYALIGNWFGVHCKFFHKNHPFNIRYDYPSLSRNQENVTFNSLHNAFWSKCEKLILRSRARVSSQHGMVSVSDQLRNRNIQLTHQRDLQDF